MDAIKRLGELANDITRRSESRRVKEQDSEVLSFNCNVIIELRGPDGELKDSRYVHNLITTAGKNKILDITSPIVIEEFKYMAIGTGATAANAADTALQTEVARSTAITATNPSAGTCQFANTYAAGTGTGAITEVGLLDASSSGTLLNRTVFSVINKGALDALTMTVQIT